MTFNEAKAKRRKEWRRERKISIQREKIAVERARIKKKFCNKISCHDCIFDTTENCVEFVKDGDFSAMLNWAKGKRADTFEAEAKEI